MNDDDVIPPDDADQYSARRIAQLIGVGATTVSNWTKHDQAPLAFEQIGSRVLIRWADLLTFLDAHPQLPSAARVRHRLRDMAVATDSAGSMDTQTLVVIARSAQSAAAHASEAALAAVKKEVDIAAEHQRVVEELVAAVRKLDEALTVALTDNNFT